MSINCVVISGNLTKDPELRTTASGMAVLSLGVAVNDRQKNKQTGEWEDYANFVDCTMFGERGAKIQQYLSKGSKVTIKGKLHYSSWEKDGQKRSKIEVFVDDIDFMSKDNSQQQQGQYQPPQTYGGGQQGYQQPPEQQQMNYSAPPMPDPTTSVYDEDIPF